LIVACPQKHKNRDLICKDSFCKNSEQRCVASAVIDTWKKAGFQDFIISGSSVRDKILKLHNKFIKLYHLKSLNWNSSEGNFSKIQTEFLEESNTLFDISLANFEQKVNQDSFRSENAKDEDIQFYLDQKRERNMYITEELDEVLQNLVEKKIIMLKKMEDAIGKARITMNAVKSNELDVSLHSSENDSESEKSLDSLDDEDLPNRLSHSTKSKIMISISAEDLVDSTAAVSARYRVGIRPQSSLVAAICNKAGVNLEDIILSRRTVHRKRFQKIEAVGDKLRHEIITTLKGKKLCVHFDGKRVKQIEEDLKITVSVERIAVSVTSPDMDDKDDVLLGVV